MTDQTPETKMIKIHSRMEKSRSAIFGSHSIYFNEDGIAEVPDCDFVRDVILQTPGFELADAFFRRQREKDAALLAAMDKQALSLPAGGSARPSSKFAGQSVLPAATVDGEGDRELPGPDLVGDGAGGQAGARHRKKG